MSFQKTRKLTSSPINYSIFEKGSKNQFFMHILLNTFSRTKALNLLSAVTFSICLHVFCKGLFHFFPEVINWNSQYPRAFMALNQSQTYKICIETAIGIKMSLSANCQET